MPPKKETRLVWKQGDGWLQYDPPRNHPCYEEWQKKKEKYENDRSKD